MLSSGLTPFSCCRDVSERLACRLVTTEALAHCRDGFHWLKALLSMVWEALINSSQHEKTDSTLRYKDQIRAELSRLFSFGTSLIHLAVSFAHFSCVCMCVIPPWLFIRWSECIIHWVLGKMCVIVLFPLFLLGTDRLKEEVVPRHWGNR